ncbi:MAG TPA: hypothetical protein VIU11_14165 [Nakamurella sp.]
MTAPDRPPSGRRGRWSATDAANFTFDRFVEEVAADGGTRDAPVGGPTGSATVESADRFRVGASVARTVDVYAGLLTNVFHSLTADLTQAMFDPPAGRRQPEPVVLVGHPGARTGAVLWIHNVSGAFVPELTLRLTDLWHANGSRLGAELGGTEPERLEGSTAPRRAAWVGISVPPATDRGSYHGHILANGLPDAAVAVKLIVR